ARLSGLGCIARFLNSVHDENDVRAIGSPLIAGDLSVHVRNLARFPAVPLEEPQLGSRARRPCRQEAEITPIGAETRLAHALPLGALLALMPGPFDRPERRTALIGGLVVPGHGR